MIFYGLLLLNHLFHIYEVQTNGFKQGFGSEGVSLSAGFIFRLLLLVIIVLVGLQLVRRQEEAYEKVKWVAILFLAYGLFLAVAVVYRETEVVGSFSGFIYVMICLPMLLHISDHMKIKMSNSVGEGKEDED
jgi:di/tricarboxylate transporter